MNWVSLIGIIVSIGLFVYMCYKKFLLLLVTIVATVIVALSSGINPLTAFTDTYMTGFAGFVKSYLPLFVLSALFGKVMEQTGCVRKLALSLLSITKKSKNPKFWTVFVLPMFYVILSYVGISGFVVIFTVLAIGREMFLEIDIPWCLYPYGSSGILPAFILGGSVYSSNIIAANGFGTNIYSAMGFSIILFIVCILSIMVLLYFDIRKFEKRGEGFYPSGKDIMDLQIDEQIPVEDLPNLIIAIIPLLTPIILLAVFKVNVLIALLAATIICSITNYKKMKDIKSIITQGITASFNPIINVSGAVGYVSVIKTTLGFQLVLGGLDNLPPLYSAIILGALTSFVVANSNSSLSPIMAELVEKYAASGVSNGIAHRLALTSCMTFMTPHNSGVVNALSLTKIDYKRGSWIYFKTTCIPGVVATIVGLILLKLGVFM